MIVSWNHKGPKQKLLPIDSLRSGLGNKKISFNHFKKKTFSANPEKCSQLPCLNFLRRDVPAKRSTSVRLRFLGAYWMQKNHIYGPKRAGEWMVIPPQSWIIWFEYFWIDSPRFPSPFFSITKGLQLSRTRRWRGFSLSSQLPPGLAWCCRFCRSLNG